MISVPSLPMMVQKAATYGAELAFARRIGANVSSALRLAYETVAFHLGNARGARVAHGYSSTFSVEVVLGGRTRSVQLRRDCGDIYIFYRTFLQGYQSFPDLERWAGEIHTIVDLGANIGMASLYFSCRYPNARIVAVEPVSATYELLVANTRGLSAITPVRAAVVGASARAVRVTSSRAAWGNRVTTSEEEPGETVPAITMRELLDRHGIERVDLLKVDIEGAERQLFEHPAFMQRVENVLIELHPPYTAADLARSVGPLGFEVLPPDPSSGRRATAVRRRSR